MLVVELRFTEPRLGPFNQILNIDDSLPHKPDQDHAPLP